MAKVQSPPEMSLSAAIPVDQEQGELNLLAMTMAAALRLVSPWQARVVPGAPEAKDRTITLAEVSQHDTYRDCWVVIYDRVYDITDFFDEVS